MSPSLQFSDTGQIWVWPLPSQEFSLQHLYIAKSTLVAFQLWSGVAIWTAGRSALVVCDGNVNAEKYISILDQGLLPVFDSGKLSPLHPFHARWSSLSYHIKDKGLVDKKDKMFTMAKSVT